MLEDTVSRGHFENGCVSVSACVVCSVVCMYRRELSARMNESRPPVVVGLVAVRAPKKV